jgi:hypothetical protein
MGNAGWRQRVLSVLAFCDHHKQRLDYQLTELSGWIAVLGLPPGIFWRMATPVLVVSDSAVGTKLTSLTWTSTTSVSGTTGGDAIVRIFPETLNAAVNLDGSVFTSIVGRINLNSPLSLTAPTTPSSAPAVLVSLYSGSITFSQTRFLTQRTDVAQSIGSWMGSARTGTDPLAEQCPVCKTAKELHKTHVVYIIIGSSVGGLLLIGATVLIIVHVRNRMRNAQIAAAGLGE